MSFPSSCHGRVLNFFKVGSRICGVQRKCKESSFTNESFASLLNQRYFPVACDLITNLWKDLQREKIPRQKDMKILRTL